ncbi:MAG: restriction endonuclease [Gammaproteobacteria bacterium]|nr:restriction endonuclease [Gammaproteobacteria bacterium]
MTAKEEFEIQLKDHVEVLQQHISSEDGQWAVKGFIDVFRNVYTISSDTKIVSKILEIHLFPKILEFSQRHGYRIVLPEHQNHYPDISFVKSDDESVKFAVDFKTTYRNPDKAYLCNGFTLGSHGEYFQNRDSTKNIRFPYKSYAGHFCLGIIYDRIENTAIDETRPHKLEELQAIKSVVGNFQFFVAEKWKIASDKRGSGNTANIGSINRIMDIINGDGMFSQLGEDWFDEYWINFNKITIPDNKGGTKKINNLKEFVAYRNGDSSLIVPKNNSDPSKVRY